MATTLTSKTVKIRKPHECYSCFRKFLPPASMNYWAGIYEGDFNAAYSCMTCVEIMNMSSETEFPNGFVHEMLDDGQTPEQLLEQFKDV